MPIPKALAKELELPVTCTHTGELVSLRDFVRDKDKKSHLSLSSLELSQQAKITAERLKRIGSYRQRKGDRRSRSSVSPGTAFN